MAGEMAAAGDTELLEAPDLYTCSVCLENMQNRKPRLLSCHHSFCEYCTKQLVRRGEIKCPTCRVSTAVPNDDVTQLAMNFWLLQMPSTSAMKASGDITDPSAPPEENNTTDMQAGNSNSRTSDAGCVSWQWIQHDEKWLNYPVAISKILEDNLAAGVTKVDLSQTEHRLPYIVNLQAMVQVRIETGNVRKVKRCQSNTMSATDGGRRGSVSPPCTDGGRVHCWQWKDNRGRWQTYSLYESEILEIRCREGASKVDFQQTPCKTPYVVDFNYMKQRNAYSGKLRDIRRT